MSRPAARILIVSGPSGVGKSSVCRRLLDEDRMVLSVSATTRAPRGAEVEGRDYFFLTREEFERRAEAGEFLEWAEVHGTTLYGTPAAPVQDHLAAGRSVLLTSTSRAPSWFGPRGRGWRFPSPACSSSRPAWTSCAAAWKGATTRPPR